MKVKEKIQALRQLMKQYGMAAYIVPSDDFHSSEYVGEYFKARAYLSGFTGSAGTLVVLLDKAALWTDGRYFLQAEAQLKESGISLMRSGQPGVLKIEEYLSENLQKGETIGFDGRTVTGHFVKQLADKMKEQEIHFYGEKDLVAKVWKDRPALSRKPVWELPTKYSGLDRNEKMRMVREKMKQKQADCLVLSALDEIAWLLNLRGNDVAYTPVFLSYMLVEPDKAMLFLQEEILSSDIRSELETEGIEVLPYDTIYDVLKSYRTACTMWVDDRVLNQRLLSQIPETCTIVNSEDPIGKMKAIKTPEEIENIRIAHKKDGVAVTKFLYWLKYHVAKQSITELEAADKLTQFRSEMDGFLDQSFEPIIAYGKHGAIVHYSATEQTNAVLEPRGLCLADTGAHYIEGTTDITRTIVLGEVTEQEKKLYTTVLRGNLNLGAAVFVHGLCGQNLDCLARQPLWERGLDFNHGTGHGVGYLLSVHEGPQRIHWRIRENDKPVTLEEGMIISNEPGIYLENQFGIRHENLILCQKGECNEYGQFMHFETLTLVPFDREAIDPTLMREDEIALLNAYHRRVYEEISPYLDKDEQDWLFEVTQAI